MNVVVPYISIENAHESSHPVYGWKNDIYMSMHLEIVCYHCFIYDSWVMERKIIKPLFEEQYVLRMGVLSKLDLMIH